MTAGLVIGHPWRVHLERPRRLTTTSLAVGLTSLTGAMLLVFAGVRRDDYAAAVAVGLGLLVTAVVGGAVAARRPDHPCGWILAAMPVFVTASAAATDYVQTSLAADHEYPATEAVAWVATWLAHPVVPLAAVLLLTFPTGRLPSRPWRIAAATAVVATAVAAASAAATAGGLPVAGSIQNPFGIDGADALLEAVGGVAGGVASAVVIAAVVRLVLQYRRATGLEREQLRIVARALPITIVGLAGALAAAGPLNEASFYLAVVGVTAVPVAIGWAVVRHRLFDIEVLVNRGLVYGSLTIAVGSLYIAVVTGLGQALRQSVGLGVSVVATAVVAVAFGPLRDALQRAADRLMYGDRADPYAALSRLGHRLEDASAPEDALPLTAETLGRSLKLRGVAIEELDNRELVPAVLWGEPGPPSTAERFDLVHGRELVGQLVVWARATETLSGKDRVLLTDLCRPVAVVAHAAAVRRELQDSRQSLVTAREEERRRLRADLHDGLGPELAGVMFGLGAARNTLRADPAATEALLAGLQDQVRSTVTQVRTLVNGLAPTVEQLGLAGALREGANRLTGAIPIAVEVDVPDDLPPLSAAVEVAAYRIALEALANVTRHANARHCLVRVHAGDDLTVEVTDDGDGLPETVVPGVGLPSMRQRAGEVGGSWSIAPVASGGTCVIAKLPLR